jgi:hypothetical protein
VIFSCEAGHGEQVVWQQRAAARLTEIITGHRHLPVLAWTVSDAGSALVGRVIGPGRAAGQVRDAFDAWCTALGVQERTEQPSPGGCVHLWATAASGRVRVTLTATVFTDGGGE